MGGEQEGKKCVCGYHHAAMQLFSFLPMVVCVISCFPPFVLKLLLFSIIIISLEKSPAERDFLIYITSTLLLVLLIYCITIFRWSLAKFCIYSFNLAYNKKKLDPRMYIIEPIKMQIYFFALYCRLFSILFFSFHLDQFINFPVFCTFYRL